MCLTENKERVSAKPSLFFQIFSLKSHFLSEVYTGNLIWQTAPFPHVFPISSIMLDFFLFSHNNVHHVTCNMTCLLILMSDNSSLFAFLPGMEVLKTRISSLFTGVPKTWRPYGRPLITCF